MESDFRPAGRSAKSLQANDQTEPAKTPTPVENNFKTPDQAAAADDVAAFAVSSIKKNTGYKDKKGWRDKLRWEVIREKKWLASAAIVLVCGSIVAFTLNHVGKKPVASAGPVVVGKVAKNTATVPSALSGLPVDPAVNQRPVTGAMIENSLDARPQSGLSQAGVVFEAIAEGGITRFLALFQDQAPDNLGPIRSARPYYVQWAMGFDAAYAHVGGSPEALNDIKAWGAKDLDQFANGGAYHRISQRAAPHNVYTSLTALNQLEAAKGYGAAKFEGFTRKKAAPSKQPAARKIDVSVSGPLYNSHYDYNPATNSYERSEAGAAHIDSNTNKPLSPTVVITLVMPYGLAADDHHSQYGTIGSGQGYVFQDGTVTAITWTKADIKSQFKFTDAAGKTVRLNPGQTWITAIANPGQVTSSP
jgi:hypothetical protein